VQLTNIYISYHIYYIGVDGDNAVGVATGNGLDCPGIESLWGRDFPHLSALVLGALPAFCTMVAGFFPGGGIKWPGRGLDHPPQYSAEVKESRAISLLHLWAFVACYR